MTPHGSTRFGRRTRSVVESTVVAYAMSVALVLGALPRPASAFTTTPEILTNTISALPACLRWSVQGVCVFLVCKGLPPLCKIVTSFQVDHYVPDAVVSTWHEPLQHPWVDLGRPIASITASVGSAIVAMPLDSAGTSTPVSETHLSRDADVIGNPIGLLAYLVAGNPLPPLPKLVKAPGFGELSKFPPTIKNIGQSWAGAPKNVAANLVAETKKLAELPDKIANMGKQIAALPAQISKIQTTAGKVSDVVNKGMQIGDKAQKILDVDLSPLKLLTKLIGAQPFLSTAVFCPGAASAFGLHYQSAMDGLFWRGIVPAEMIYPQSWFPGMSEIGSFPANTWGSVFPRTNELSQAHPVKASAVLATRVADIVGKTAQPHIYDPLTVNGSGFLYFAAGDRIAWQRLYPSAQASCGTFGANDSLKPASYGDGLTTSEEGYVWGLWRHYRCCQDRGGFFLAVVPL